MTDQRLSDSRVCQDAGIAEYLNNPTLVFDWLIESPHGSAPLQHFECQTLDGFKPTAENARRVSHGIEVKIRV